MIDLWTFLAFQAISVAAGVTTAVVILVVGGAGGMRALSRRLVISEQRVEDVDARITSEVKKRASGAAQDARTKAKTAEEEVAEVLGTGKGAKPASVASLARRRPSVVGG